MIQTQTYTNITFCKATPNTAGHLLFRLLLLFLAGGLNSCDSSFLNRYPESELEENNFFKTVNDLETFSYGLYDLIPYAYDDNNSDNILTIHGDNDIETLLRGEISSYNTVAWDWSALRSINMMLAHLPDIQGDEREIRHYEGIGRFFRALFYWDKVKTFGAVPWYDKVLTTQDLKELYKPRDARETVMDRVIEDLEYAIAHTQETEDKTVLGKNEITALAARIALYEGTFRKYHTELIFQDRGTELLKKASQWAGQIMQKSQYSLVSINEYASMFNDNRLEHNPEIIFYRKFDKISNVSNNAYTVCDYYWGMDYSLVCTFLNADGSRYTEIPNYEQHAMSEIFRNRDPRLSIVIAPPGWVNWDEKTPHIPKLSLGGFAQLKFYPARKELSLGWGATYTDLPIIRLAEIYLIYAEAKAELEELTQADLDLSLNLVRQRANLPALTIETANQKPDPWLAGQYYNITGKNRGILLEIMRERRVELACEGLRKDDLFRRKLGANLCRFIRQGLYIPALGPLDITGNGEADVAILWQSSPDDTQRYKGLRLYYLMDKNENGQTWYLEKGDHGHIQITSQNNNTRNFIEPCHYFYPIPYTEIVLNPNLKQMYGWQ